MTIYEAALRYSNGTDDYYNVIHFDITGDTPLDLQDLTDEIAGEFGSNAAATIAPAVALMDITYRLDIDGSIGTTFTPTGGQVDGSSTDNQYAGQLTMLVQKRTNGQVRPVLGRAFMPGISSEALNSAGGWTASSLAAVEDFYDAIILVPFAGNGQAEMLIKAGNPSAPNTNAYNSVAECVALPIPSALQSRKKGRGA